MLPTGGSDAAMNELVCNLPIIYYTAINAAEVLYPCYFFSNLRGRSRGPAVAGAAGFGGGLAADGALSMVKVCVLKSY